jgi:hypothetical protein
MDRSVPGAFAAAGRCRLNRYTQHRGTENTEDTEKTDTIENRISAMPRFETKLVFSVFLCVLCASVLGLGNR